MYPDAASATITCMTNADAAYTAVAEYLREKAVIDVAEISYLGTGFVNDNYLITGSDGAFVLRLRRDDIPDEENRLKNEWIIYSFLEHQGYPWVPRVRYFDAETPALLISYIPAKQTAIKDIPASALGQLMQQIAEYHTYSYADFATFCSQRQLPYSEPITPMEDFERFERARFEYLKTHFHDRAWIEWITPHFVEYERRAQARPLGKPRLIHGDIKSNILMDEEEMFWFIDWELGRFSYYDDLGCILSRETATQQMDPRAVDLYLQYSGKDQNTFADERMFHPYTRYLSSILWALQRYVETTEKGLPDSEMYLARAQKAKKEFEEELRHPKRFV